jgi:hypothetical protein
LFAIVAFIEVLACVCGHSLFLLKTTLWASDR